MPAHYLRRLCLLLTTLGGSAVIACTSSSTGASTGPSTGGTPRHIVVVSGDSQTAAWGLALPAPLVVKVTDSVGSPVTNTPVSWAMTFDDAPLSQHITTTDASGQTQIDPTLVGFPGLYSVAAAVNAASVTFTGSGNAGLVPSAATVSTNLFASCGLTKQGAALCWGAGTYGQLGILDSTTHTGPAVVSGGYTFTHVSVGTSLACGIVTGGTLYCWGSPIYSGFGNGAPAGGAVSYAPIPAANGRKYSQISVGQASVCGISSSAVYCWGNNGNGALGNGNTTNEWSPVAVSTPSGVTFASVTTGWGYACALSTTGAAYCWGGNGNGVLGTGSSTPDSSAIPIPVSGGLKFTSLSAGTIGICGLTASGTVYCWGTAVNGNGTTSKETAPTAVQQTGLRFTQLSVAGPLACAITSAGAGYCWGQNDHGSLGSGSYSASGLTPTAVAGGLTFSYISSGALLACGVTTSDATYCWGNNTGWALGLGFETDTAYDTPHLLPGLSSQTSTSSSSSRLIGR